MRRLLPALAGSLLVGLLAVPAIAARDNLARPGVDNPHGRPDKCLACHEAGAAPNKPGAPKPSVVTCRDCHPDADMHPVDMAPDVVPVPEEWPLEKGQMACATCHAEPACEEERDDQAPWLRGGTPTNRTDFCYRCHERKRYTREDPHHPKKARDARDPSCSVCHSGLPAEGALASASRLRLESGETCAECHPSPVHAGVDGHLGEKVKPEVAAELPKTMPLDAEGRITCWTCHEVHGDVAPGRNPARKRVASGIRDRAQREDWEDALPKATRWPGDVETGHPALLGATIEDGALCRACHGEGP